MSLLSSVVTEVFEQDLCSHGYDQSGLTYAPHSGNPSDHPRAPSNGRVRIRTRTGREAGGAGFRMLAVATGGLMLAAEGGTWWNVSR